MGRRREKVSHKRKGSQTWHPNQKGEQTLSPDIGYGGGRKEARAQP